MSKENLTMIQDQRKVSDILLALEEKILLLTQTIAANDMNNKLILDRLNKLLVQKSDGQAVVKSANESRIKISQPSVEISNEPITKRKPVVLKPIVEDPKPARVATDSHTPKIPVGQRITDHTGKDLYMADVTITNIATGEAIKAKTSAVGKWQAYLTVGKYSVHVSKIIDATSLNKIESLQEIEITPQMKSLQLPIAIIKR